MISMTPLYFTVHITMENDACHTSEDVSDVLRKALPEIATGRVKGTLYDVNGNRVGYWEYGDKPSR
jgi:hypothetical protein